MWLLTIPPAIVILLIILIYGITKYPVFLFGFAPFFIIVGAGICTAIVGIFLKSPSVMIEQILIGMGIVFLIIMITLLIISKTCDTVYVTEAFTEISSDTLNTTERDVCSMMSDVIAFKQGELGQVNPILIADQIHAMVAAVDGPITQCTQSQQSQPDPQPQQLLLVPQEPPVDDKTFFSDPDMIRDRISRMDRTLKQFILPQAKRTFAALNTCGPAPAPVSVPEHNNFEQHDNDTNSIPEQLSAVQTLAKSIRANYLVPIQTKQGDLKAGRLSDCDRQAGAKAAMTRRP